MERLQSELERRKTDIFSDSTHRMPERPLSIQSGKGRGHEDLGSSFAPSQPVRGKAIGSNFKPALATSRPIITSLEQDSFSDSDDELLLSEGAQPSGLSPIPKRVVRSKTMIASTPQKANLAPNGHPYHPSFPPKEKLPKFTRIKKQPQVEESIPVWPLSSSLPDADDSQELCRPISDYLASQTKPFQPTTKLKKENHKAFARPGPGKNSMSRKTVTPSSTSGDKLPKYSKHVTKPRAVKAGGSMVRGRSPEATPRASRQHQPFPLGSHSSVYDGSSHASDASPARKSAREPSTARKEKTNALSRKSAAPFPMSQPKEKANAPSRQPAAPFPMSPLGKSNLPKQPLPEPTGPSPFPLSLHTPKSGLTRSETLGNFPAPSPLASPVQPPSRDKGKSRALTPHQDENDDDELATNHCDTVQTNVALRPFSVGSSGIKIADRRSPQSSSESMGSKRASGGGDGERGRKAKRHKEDNSRLILGGDEHLDEDSFEIDRVIDPSTVCPYCDEPLPRNPTPQLENLLATAKRKSYPDPRPRNSSGLKAPLGIYISACQRHRFETHSLPEAMEKGWPQSIDFKKVPKRVEGMKGALEAIITDTDIHSDNEDSVEVDARGPRARSDFWKEIKKQIKKQGSRTVTGVKGQFASFEKTQPGYYGELGFLIIHQTLYNLFPFSSFEPSSIAPLTPAEFIQLVLIPEAAVGLIMQDLGLDRDEAIVTLRESSQYGVAMFPDTGSGKSPALGDDDDEGVADRIVMERAKARRLELEEEEQLEEQMWKEERAKRRCIAQMERKEKARQRAEQLKKSKELPGYSSREVSEATESETQRRPLRNAAKAGSRTATDSETDNMSVDSSTSRRSTRSRTGARMYRTASAKSDSSNMQISDDSTVEIVDENEQPRVRRSTRHAAHSVNDIGQHSEAASSSKMKTRAGRSKNIEGDDADVDVGDTPLKPVPEIDEESTPRPHRRSKVPAVSRPHPILGISGVTTAIKFPLQVARSRSTTSATLDGWRNNLIPGASEAEESDDSQAVQPSMDVYSWLLSPTSSSSLSP
ncbi:RTC4-like domain-containing protein [Suillus subalutaceus]|uniref:RTC4-like domain-containing protein n=1 Tax=Suillus subalutaceus TaxID=48586 RepID=UPI001B88518A|nr:RTC4-like domain-containing protein [Suillus subalutaceus]KAG1860270.1 RTC4-like domain-containing protein [Suillus subalutaceus]